MMVAHKSPDPGVVAAAGDIAVDVPADWPNRTHSRLVTVAGRRWHVQVAGAGPDVVLLHGTGAATHSWRQLLPLVAAQYRVIAVDLPGHGFTSRGEHEALTLSRVSRGLRDLLKHMDVYPAVIVGHSAAAAIAIEIVSGTRFSETRMLGLSPALLPYGGSFRPFLVPMTRWAADSSLVTGWVTGKARDVRAVRRVLASTGSSVDEVQVAWYQKLLRVESHVQAMLSMMGHWDLSGVLGKLDALGSRALLAYGQSDLAVPIAQLDVVQKRAPRCNYRILDRRGHLAHEEAPAEALQLVHEAVGGEEQRRPRCTDMI